MYCTNCGRQIIDYSVFCEYCGAKQQNNIINNLSEDNVQKKNSDEDNSNTTDNISTSDSNQHIDDFSGLDLMSDKSEIEDNDIANYSNINQELNKLNQNKYDEYNIKKVLSIKKKIIIFSVVMVLIILSVITVYSVQNINAKKDIDYVVEQFNKDKIDYNEAIGSLNNIKCYERESLIQYRSSAISRIDNLNNSKEAYASAQEYMKSKKYDEAIPLYASVLKEDLNYQNAQSYLVESQKKYLESVNDLVKKYIDNNDYDLALNLCENAKQIIPDNANDIDKIITEIEDAQELYFEEQIKILEESAKTNYENGDYSAAINDYQNLYNMTEDDSYNVTIESVEYDWSNAVISAAEEQLAEGKYDAAIELLKEPKRSISDNGAIAEEEKRINSFRPFEFESKDYSNYLYTDIYTTYRDESMGWRYWWLDYCVFGGFSNVKDNLGREYDAGILLRTSNGYDVGKGTGKIDYSINGEYDYFSCVFFIEEVSKNTPCKFNLNIYGDEMLIYSSETITGGSMPINISTNIKDCHKLTIEVVYDLTDESSRGEYIVISDMCLSKEYYPINNDTSKLEDNIIIVKKDLQSSNNSSDQSKTRKTPFFGIWCYDSKNVEEAVEFSNKMSEKGIEPEVFVTTDWSNLNNEQYYVVTAGMYESEDLADDNLNSIKSTGYNDAYIKYSGEYIGNN